MFTITSGYKNQGLGVRGRTFLAVEDAERFLRDNGWRRNPSWDGHWMREESIRMFGSVCVGLMSDVTIEEVFGG